MQGSKNQRRGDSGIDFLLQVAGLFLLLFFSIGYIYWTVWLD